MHSIHHHIAVISSRKLTVATCMCTYCLSRSLVILSNPSFDTSPIPPYPKLLALGYISSPLRKEYYKVVIILLTNSI